MAGAHDQIHLRLQMWEGGPRGRLSMDRRFRILSPRRFSRRQGQVRTSVRGSSIWSWTKESRAETADELKHRLDWTPIVASESCVHRDCGW